MSAKEMKCDPSTGINLLIVGGGIGGLTFAIESVRKGHTVLRVIERRSTFDTFGDVFGLAIPALHTPKSWPGFLDTMRSKSLKPVNHFFRYDGKKIAEHPTGSVDGEQGIPLSRAHAHECLYQYAQQLGIPISFGKKVVKYFEESGKGGVVTEDGEVVLADLVVAADGVGSKSQTLIVEYPETPTSSGYALFRTTFPLEDALKDPLVNEHWKDQPERLSIHLGPDAHFVIGRNDAMNTMCWLLTHKDSGNKSQESWSAKCAATDALEYIPETQNWAPYLHALIKTTTNNEAVNWRLMWRSPQPRWSSPQHRVLQIGDACHPFLPSSGSGAVMAMEDAYSLAACLQLGGRERIPLAVKIHNKLRFERVSCAQKMGFKTRHAWHNPDWKFIEENPDEALRIRGIWLLRHHAEKYAYENFEKCAEHILNGAEFENTNIPRNYTYEPWTVDQLLKESESGKPIVDSGDWS